MRSRRPWTQTARSRCSLSLYDKGVTADIKNVVADRLHVTRLAPEVAAWVASALARRVELEDGKLVLPPALAARAAVLALGGDELLDLALAASHTCFACLASDGWLSPRGRSFAATYLVPRAEAALLPELQRLASAVTAAGQ